MKIKNKNGKKIFGKLLILAAILIFCVSVVFFTNSKIKAASSGWGMGVWNNSILQYLSGSWQLVDNPANNPPTIGRLSSNNFQCGDALSKKYSVNLGEMDENGDQAIIGNAWFGIGSQADPLDQTSSCPKGTSDGDLPSLGWLSFSTAYPSFCTGSDCHGAMVRKNGDLDGWAHIDSMGEDGWVRLKDPDSNSSKYRVTMDSEGILSGYGWNSGRENDPTLVGNSGLGWVKMDGLKLGLCKLGTKTIQFCSDEKITDSSCDFSKYCTGDSTEASCSFTGDTSWTCSNVCGEVSGNIFVLDPELGVCGSLDGQSACDKSNRPVPSKLCSDALTYNKDFEISGIIATWSCGNDCGKKVSCSASAQCGWIETNP